MERSLAFSTDHHETRIALLALAHLNPHILFPPINSLILLIIIGYFENYGSMACSIELYVN